MPGQNWSVRRKMVQMIEVPQFRKTVQLSQQCVCVLLYLAEHKDDYLSPTDLGKEVGGKEYDGASSWASPKCRRLVEEGLAVRQSPGRYKVTEKGLKHAVATVCRVFGGTDGA